MRHADAVFFLAGGRVAAHGTHDELVASSPQYAALVRRQMIAAQSMHTLTGHTSEDLLAASGEVSKSEVTNQSYVIDMHTA